MSSPLVSNHPRSRRRFRLGGDRFDRRGDTQVVLGILPCEPRVVRPPVALLELIRRTNRPGEKTAAKRGEGDEPDTELTRHRQHLGLGVARPQGVLGLQRGDGVDGTGAPDRGSAGLGQANLPDPPRRLPAQPARPWCPRWACPGPPDAGRTDQEGRCRGLKETVDRHTNVRRTAVEPGREGRDVPSNGTATHAPAAAATLLSWRRWAV
jgi:hypothetical protein